MGIGHLEAVQEEEGNLEDARRIISFLKERQKTQTRLIQGWKSKYRNENGIVAKMKKARDEHLKQLQSQLLVFESYLKKTRVEFETLVKHKDDVIKRQHQLICSVALALVKRGGQEELRKLLPGIKVDGPTSSAPSTMENRTEEPLSRKDSLKRTDTESLNDSDSAIMMEDAYDSIIVLPTGKGEIKVMRSVSDALEIVARVAAANKKLSLQNSPRRTHPHGSLSSTPSGSSEESDESPPSTMSKSHCEHIIRPVTILPRLQSTPDSKSSAPLITSAMHSCKSPSCLSSYNSYNSSYSSVCSSIRSSINSSYHPYTGVTQREHSICDSNSNTPRVSSTIASTSPGIIGHTTVSQTKINNVEIDDSDSTLSDNEQEKGFCSRNLLNLSQPNLMDQRLLYGSYEKLTDYEIMYVRSKPKDEINQVTYNRVMSNHRSVTKPKDVKYKRINKAKSRSLEELRGKLKLWDIHKQCLTVDMGQSDA